MQWNDECDDRSLKQIVNISSLFHKKMFNNQFSKTKMKIICGEIEKYHKRYMIRIRYDDIFLVSDS